MVGGLLSVWRTPLKLFLVYSRESNTCVNRWRGWCCHPDWKVTHPLGVGQSRLRGGSCLAVVRWPIQYDVSPACCRDLRDGRWMWAKAWQSRRRCSGWGVVATLLIESQQWTVKFHRNRQRAPEWMRLSFNPFFVTVHRLTTDITVYYRTSNQEEDDPIIEVDSALDWCEWHF
jgi:hypothetical protein